MTQIETYRLIIKGFISEMPAEKREKL